jgi:hypothetical protein
MGVYKMVINKKVIVTTLAAFVAQPTFSMSTVRFVSLKTVTKKVAAVYPELGLSSTKIKSLLDHAYLRANGLEKKGNYHPELLKHTLNYAKARQARRNVIIAQIYGTGRAIEVEYDVWDKTQNSNFYSGDILD